MNQQHYILLTTDVNAPVQAVSAGLSWGTTVIIWIAAAGLAVSLLAYLFSKTN